MKVLLVPLGVRFGVEVTAVYRRRQQQQWEEEG
jgi:hypothetical protein